MAARSEHLGHPIPSIPDRGLSVWVIPVTCPQERYHILLLVPAPVEGREGRASSGTRATA